MEELFNQILARDVDEDFDKSEYEGMPSVSADQPIGEGGATASEFEGHGGAAPTPTVQLSEDDDAVESQMQEGDPGSAKKLASGSQGSGDGGAAGQSNFGDGGFTIAKGDHVHYSDATDKAIAAAMEASPDGVNLSPGPSFRVCASALQYPRICANDVCKAAFPRYLTVCPSCSTDTSRNGGMSTSLVQMDKGVVDSLIPIDPDADLVIG